jgi:alanine racemase
LYTTSQIADIIHATVSGDEPDTSISVLLTDSRQLTEPHHTLFIALVTERNDAHQYIYALVQKGVKVFVGNFIPENCKGIEGICFLLVKDTRKALQQLAAHHRRKFKIPVIGITGSNGKTIVKEWLYQLLKADYSIVRSPKSFNSQIGVPLSVWQMKEEHGLGIFEAGISEPGEMPVLREIIRPTIGILTSLGTAHDEGFRDATHKLKEKLNLFAESETVIVNALSLPENYTDLLTGEKWFIISRSPHATLQILHSDAEGNQTRIKAHYKGSDIKLLVPFTDEAGVNNAITCWATLLLLEISEQEIQQRMLRLQSVEMRLELKLGNNNCILINDFYNSDINALEIALHHLKQQHRGGQKIVVLSDIEQSGKLGWELYTHVARLLSQFHIDVFVGIGKEISSQRKLFPGHAHFYASTQEFLADTKINPDLQFHNAIILLKGARSFGFEAISKQLQQKSHDTVLEINLNKLVHNINFYRSQLEKNTKLMCMVKATGYGSGSTEIAFTLQHHQVDYLAVAYADEGVELRKAGIHLPVMVMSPEEASYDDMLAYQLEPELFSFKVIRDFSQALQSKAISDPYPVHIKLDTGMHRLGFEEAQVDELCEVLKKETSIKVKSIFSHLAGSESKTFDDFTKQQIALFEKMAEKIEAAIGYSTIRHICNSGAITRFRQAHYDMVRLGIGMYGIGFNELEKQQLQNISSLKTRISQIKPLKKGETVGYSRRGLAEQDMTIATIPIGYADGLSRRTGNGNFSVYINGAACKTIGSICMDMCMVDVTNLTCAEGDEVIVFETNQQLMDLSEAMDTIPYEVLTNISTRVKRVYVQE